MISGIFNAIALLLKLLKLWDQFGDYMDAKRVAEAEEKRQRREQAIRDQQNAKTEEEFDDAQDRIVDNSN